MQTHASTAARPAPRTRGIRSRRSAARGFTLVELAIVVVVVGILAVIGGVIYAKHRATARSAEAKQVTNGIRMAQEGYKSERGIYANISSNTGSYYPAPSPNSFATEWGGDCSNCVDGPDGWRQLAVHPSSPVVYGYATIAGTGGSSPTFTAPPGVAGFTSSVPPPATGEPLRATDPFYVTVAWGDTDGDGTPSIITSYSTSNVLVVQNEGE